MKKCPNCNIHVEDSTKFCPNCGYLLPDNTPILQDPIVQRKYIPPNQKGTIPPYPTNGYQMQMPVNPDKTNAGLCVLSVFVPLFGLIYYFVKRGERPIEAKSCLKAGLISAGVSVILSFILSFALIGGIFHAVNKLKDEDYDWNITVSESGEQDDSAIFAESDSNTVSEKKQVLASRLKIMLTTR